MGCSPIHNVLKKRVPIIDCKNSPIHKGRQSRDKKYIDELRVMEGISDPFENYNNQVFHKETKYGRNYVVNHILTGKKRFMKILKRTKLPKDLFTKEDLLNQIELLKHLTHPNIIKLYEVFESDNKIYMIYEYCEGGSLLDVLTKESAFNEIKCKNIMRQLFSALSYCHMKGVVHTALSPDHIVIETTYKDSKKNEWDNNMIVKIIDFGAFNLLSYSKQLLTLGFKSVSNPYFSSPELKEGISSDKCDMWSCGVIMYLLLSGELPFRRPKTCKENNENNKNNEINQNSNLNNTVQNTNLTFDGETWDTVSSEAKDLISKLLKFNPNLRINANKALKHDFFVYDLPKQKLSKKTFNEVVRNMRSFNLKYKLQEAVLGFIVHHLLRKEDMETLRKSFLFFDKNNDGKISKDELIEGLSRIMNPIHAEIECNKILNNLGVSKNEAIEYEDFLTVALGKDKIVNEANLKLIFDLMDINKNGKVTKFELRNFFLGNLTTESLMADNNYFAQIINEIDVNNDGEINYNEFKKLMTFKD